MNLAMSRPRRATELVVDDFDDLLGGRERGGDLGAEGFGLDVVDEGVDDGEVDVGLEEGEADLAHGFGDVFVGEGALAAEGLEGALELVGEVFKHGGLLVSLAVRVGRGGPAGAGAVTRGRPGRRCSGAGEVYGRRVRCCVPG